MNGLLVLSCAGVDLYAIPIKACDPAVKSTLDGYVLRLKPPSIPNDTFTVDAWRVDADLLGMGQLIKIGGAKLDKSYSVMNGKLTLTELVLTVTTR